MSLIFHSLVLFALSCIIGALLFGFAGLLVARAHQKNMFIGWIAGMFLGPFGIALVGLSVFLAKHKSRNLSQFSEGV
jgi:Na+/proline symporter